MRAVFRLFIDSRRPVGFKERYIAGRCQGDAGSACPDRNDDQLYVRVALEGLDCGIPVFQLVLAGERYRDAAK